MANMRKRQATERDAERAFLLAQGFDPERFDRHSFVSAWRRGLIEVTWKKVEGK